MPWEMSAIVPREPPHRLRELHLRALQIAVSDIGKGEQGSNNRGPYIERIRSVDGTGRGPAGAGAWCACFASACLIRAAVELDYILPVRTTRSAQALYKRTGRIGTFSAEPLPGDLICWRRTNDAGDWRGHVGLVEFVEGGRVHTVEGNRGKFPSRVARYGYDLQRELNRKLLGFSRLY